MGKGVALISCLIFSTQIKLQLVLFNSNLFFSLILSLFLLNLYLNACIILHSFGSVSFTFFFTNSFNSLINFVLFCFSIIHNINSPSVSNYLCPILLPASHWMVENGNESFSSNPGPIFFHIELIFLFNSQIRQELIDTQIWFFCQTDFDLSHWLQ